MNIITAIDFTDITPTVISKTAEMASALNAAVWVIHITEPDPVFVSHDADSKVMRDQLASHFHQEHQQLQALAEQLRSQKIETTALLLQGSTAETITRQIEKLQAELLIIGKNKHGFVHRWLLGSNSQDILRQSPIATLLVPGSEPNQSSE